MLLYVKFPLVIEDEIHHLMLCTKFDDIRYSLTQLCMQKIPRFRNMSVNDKFVKIMKSQDPQIISETGAFLIRAASRQDNLIV